MSQKKEEVKESEDSKIREIKIAHYYFREHEDHTQTIIATKLGMSQSEVSRIIQNFYSNKSNVVSIRINYSTIPNLRKKLLDTFEHLDDIVISQVGIFENEIISEHTYKNLGEEAAKFFIRKFSTELPNQLRLSMGIGCGKTLSTFIESMAQLKWEGKILPTVTSIYPLAILRTPEIKALSPAVFVANLIRVFPGAMGKASHFSSDGNQNKSKKN